METTNVRASSIVFLWFSHPLPPFFLRQECSSHLFFCHKKSSLLLHSATMVCTLPQGPDSAETKTMVMLAKNKTHLEPVFEAIAFLFPV